MYSKERLAEYPYFSARMREGEVGSFHDSLTGLLARPSVLGLIRDLIERGVPFSLSILDLDNFKSVNDRYGHHTGDQVLAEIGASLAAFLGTAGLAGRFGGDEFLLVNLRDTEYAATHRFFDGMFGDEGVFRRTLDFGSTSIYVTATVGCASFPKDASDYDTLFQLADKTLYRGKAKGRNCFILYVEQKHRNIQIRSLAGRSLCEIFRAMAEGFDKRKEPATRLRHAFTPIRQNFFLQKLWYLNGEGELFDTENNALLTVLRQPAVMPGEGILPVSGEREIGMLPAELGSALHEAGMDSALLARVGGEEENLGFLIFCPEAHTSRIWQDKECAAAFILSHMLAQELRNSG